MAEIARNTSLSVYFRPDHSTAWTLLGSSDFVVPDGSAPQSRSRVRFSANLKLDCNEATKEALKVGKAFQFRVAWTGRLTIMRFSVVAPVLDDPARPQCQVDNPSASKLPEEEFHDFDYEVTL